MSDLDIRTALPRGVAGGRDDATEPFRSLWRLEQEQWITLSAVDNTVFYDRVLSQDAVMAIPSPFEFIDRERTLAEVAASGRVTLAEVQEPRVIDLSPDAAVLSYVITQQRTGDDAFTAAICSVYSRSAGRWFLRYHQQTPLTLRAHLVPGSAGRSTDTQVAG